MASVYQRKDRWYLRYRDERGRWRDRVSNARTKTEAKRLAGDLERRCERQRLAERLGVSTATVYGLIDGAVLAHVRVSNAIRIAPADLTAYVADSTRGASAAHPSDRGPDGSNHAPLGRDAVTDAGSNRKS